MADDAPQPDAPEAPQDVDSVARWVEALLLTSDRPQPEARLAEMLELGDDGRDRVLEAIESLNAVYDETRRSFRAERVAGGWQLLTRPELGDVLEAATERRQSNRLSPAAIETLSIIAYRQPIMRAEIEAIRGVASGEVLRGLLERRLIRIAGRAEELGRPMLYGTTSEFLHVFGLAGLNDLPRVEGLKREPAYSPPKPDSRGNAGDSGESTPSKPDPEADQAASGG